MTQPAAFSSSSDHRVQAVLALLRGEPAAQVSVWIMGLIAAVCISFEAAQLRLSARL